MQLFIPGGTFHTARVIGDARWFLGASTEWPGVEPADVELGNADALAAKYPKVAAEIRTLPGAGEVTGHGLCIMPSGGSMLGIPRHYSHFVFGAIQSALTCFIAAGIASVPSWSERPFP